MHAKPLSPVVTLDGQPAAGETIIRQLIKELGHCQEQLAACLPDANAPRREVGGVDGESASEGPTVAASSGAVHALVSSALRAHDDHIAMLQAESTHLREQIEQVNARRREFLEFLQTGVARP